MVKKPSGDPLLKGGDWLKVRAYWLTGAGRHTPCARCGKPIDRTTPERGPWSLDVGHIVDRAVAKDLGWTAAQMNTLSNTQPEHARCGRRAGAHLGARRRWKTPTNRTSRTW
mgnify:CR=1 FL=1